MSYTFDIISVEDSNKAVGFLYQLNDEKIELNELKKRFSEMNVLQNYLCAGVYYNNELVGITGLWFSTRHYVGKSVELDHVYIDSLHRGKGLGKKFMAWIINYSKSEGCTSIELNTYVQNHPSHKFYYNQGFEILGYHFLKRL